MAPSGAWPVEDQATIVFVPPCSLGESSLSTVTPLEDGFEEARRLLKQGASVRLVAHGATASCCWPDWVHDCADLVLTELGAYRPEGPIGPTRELASDLRGWLDEIFDCVIPGVSAGRAFFGSAAGRVFQPVFDGVPYAANLALAHPGARVHCVDPHWLGLEVLRCAIKTAGGDVFPRRPRRRRFWKTRLYSTGLYHLIRALAGQIRNYIRARPSHNELLALRRRSSEPLLWVALVPDWRRINAHVIDRIAIPALADGLPLGVLLCTTLTPGERTDEALRERRPGEIWPGLGALRPQLGRLAIDQIVGPETILELVNVVASGIVASCRTVRRLGRCSSVAKGSLRAELYPHLSRLAALATTDVLQAIAAADAAKRVGKTHNLSDSIVVFASLGLADTEAADLVLQAHGATTVDFVHGSGGENWYGLTENSATLRVVWTKTDAEICRQLGRAAFVAPPAKTYLPECGAELPLPRSVLLLTNYTHVDWEQSGYPFEPFQIMLLDAIAAVRKACPEIFQFRWRPHPNDCSSSIRRGHARVPFVEISRSRSLDTDINWAELIVASPSSTISAAMQRGVPVFVHAPPAFSFLPDLKVISEKRRFFYPEELASQIASCLSTLRSNPEEYLAPERKARGLLFYESDWG